MPKRWLRYTSRCTNGSDAARRPPKSIDIPANAVLSENKASARARILDPSVLWPFTSVLSGIDTMTLYFRTTDCDGEAGTVDPGRNKPIDGSPPPGPFRLLIGASGSYQRKSFAGRPDEIFGGFPATEFSETRACQCQESYKVSTAC